MIVDFPIFSVFFAVSACSAVSAVNAYHLLSRQIGPEGLTEAGRAFSLVPDGKSLAERRDPYL